MSSLPPIDVQDSKMLPAVYRRNDIIRSANAAARQSPRERPEGRIIRADDGLNGHGYTRSGSTAPAAVRSGNACPKGVLVDVWA